MSASSACAHVVGRPLANVRREAFALAVATGATKTAAYVSAYPRSAGWKVGNVYKSACELAKVREVAERIAALRTAAAGEGCLKRREVLRMLSDAIREAYGRHELALAVRVVDTYCRMCGFYETEKVEARVGLLGDDERDAKIARLLRCRRDG